MASKNSFRIALQFQNKAGDYMVAGDISTIADVSITPTTIWPDVIATINSRLKKGYVVMSISYGDALQWSVGDYSTSALDVRVFTESSRKTTPLVVVVAPATDHNAAMLRPAPIGRSSLRSSASGIGGEYSHFGFKDDGHTIFLPGDASRTFPHDPHTYS